MFRNDLPPDTKSDLSKTVKFWKEFFELIGKAIAALTSISIGFGFAIFLTYCVNIHYFPNITLSNLTYVFLAITSTSFVVGFAALCLIFAPVFIIRFYCLNHQLYKSIDILFPIPSTSTSSPYWTRVLQHLRFLSPSCPIADKVVDPKEIAIRKDKQLTNVSVLYTFSATGGQLLSLILIVATCYFSVKYKYAFNEGLSLLGIWICGPLVSTWMFFKAKSTCPLFTKSDTISKTDIINSRCCMALVFIITSYISILAVLIQLKSIKIPVDSETLNILDVVAPMFPLFGLFAFSNLFVGIVGFTNQFVRGSIAACFCLFFLIGSLGIFNTSGFVINMLSLGYTSPQTIRLTDEGVDFLSKKGFDIINTSFNNKKIHQIENVSVLLNLGDSTLIQDTNSTRLLVPTADFLSIKIFVPPKDSKP